MNRLLPVTALVAASLFATSEARADPYGVGLGVAAGANLADGDGLDLDISFSWGFFVDIPLLETFYITPAATLYQLDGGSDGNIAITDIDLNFKFIVPLSRMSIGAGFTAGLTTGLGDYQTHIGGLGYVGFNLVSNLDLFGMVQYKRLTTGGNIPNYNNIHLFAGTMFRF
ncbi:MAG: hypothetical protein AAFN74_17165 [Myxococcota bacterium]